MAQSAANPNWIRFQVSGMHCASCVARVEGVLTALDGVRSARVNLATEEAVVEFDPELAPVADLVRAVERAGYRAEPAPEAGVDPLQELDRRRAGERDAWWRRFLLGAGSRNRIGGTG